MALPISPDDGAASPTSPTVVAIDRDKNSSFALRWAADHLLINGPSLVAVHVRNRNVQNLTFGFNGAAPEASCIETDADIQQLFKPYRGYCARKGILLKEAILEDSDVSKALADYINTNAVTNIVLGASTRNALARKFLNYDVPTLLTKSAPEFCSVYTIAKGKIQSFRPARQKLSTQRTLPRNVAVDASESLAGSSMRNTESNKARIRRSSAHISMDSIDISSMDLRSSSPTERKCSRISSGRSSLCDDSELAVSLCMGSMDFPDKLDFTVEAQSLTLTDIDAEMKRLKLELKQTMTMYNSACKEAVSATQKANELRQWKIEEVHMCEKARISEEAALAMAEEEKAKCKVAIEAAEKAQKLAGMEMKRRRYAEQKARRDAEEKKQAMHVLLKNDVRYRKYTIEEIEKATDHFSKKYRVGEGGYGPVFKAKLDHTPVAIKVLRPDAAQGKKQFQQEIEVLSCIRHPNMVLLLGACPEYGCLVYEFMNYGSLEDRLFRKGNTPPIPWDMRFKIAADIATGLLFLHQTKPEPLVHRDIKPANILLDRNYVCKISDVGLARLVPQSVADSMTQYHMTSAAGTFCYIDPEYQQTGKLGTKSDTYSLGVMLLQIITGRPPMGLTHQIEKSIESGKFQDFLDPTVEDWPVEEALSFAKLALKCAELRKKDRPDLGSVVLPELERLREIGMKNTANSSYSHS